jgi:hypothetical protein
MQNSVGKYLGRSTRRKKDNEEEQRKGREEYMMDLSKIAYEGVNWWQNTSSGGDLVSVMSEFCYRSYQSVT